MSSREVAELTGKHHFHVLSDIRNMLEELEITDTDFRGSYQDASGRTLPLFNLPKDLTVTLVSGYSVVMRHRIVTRWQELENVIAKPQALTPIQALLGIVQNMADPTNPT